MDIQFGNLSQLGWLWLVVLLLVLIAMAGVLRRRALRRFATPNRLRALIPPTSTARRFVKTALLVSSLIAMILALVDIRWGKTWREVPQKGIEVVFALDVSRSMLAQDIAPNRLESAKQQINDMIDSMTGDRIGLVEFAGEARRRIPLTSHHADFKQTLAEVGPDDVRLGGSRLGNAIRVAADSFLDKTDDHKAIVLFTDGEDMESNPIQAAKQAAKERGVRIFTVGLGDGKRGALIPVETARGRKDYLQYEGQRVRSKMNGQVLKKIASVSHGAYIPAGTKRVDMASVYHNFIGTVGEQEFETARINSYIPRYQWFVGLALAFLLLDSWIASAKPVKGLSSSGSMVLQP